MNFSKIPKDAENHRLDDRLDEALDESFPASDPPAVHPQYAVRGDEPHPSLSSEEGGPITRIDFEEGAISIDALLVAGDLGMTPALVLTKIREGKITSLCERGLGDDTGHFRLTVFHGNRFVRLVIDKEGNVLDRLSANRDERERPTPDAGPRSLDDEPPVIIT